MVKRPLMLVEPALESETLVARRDGATERLVACVRAQVARQVVAAGEGLVALVASKRTLSRVQQLVDLERTPGTRAI